MLEALPPPPADSVLDGAHTINTSLVPVADHAEVFGGLDERRTTKHVPCVGPRSTCVYLFTVPNSPPALSEADS